MDNKPNVFPQKNENDKQDAIKKFNEERLEVVSDIYSNTDGLSDSYANALAAMANRSIPQINDMTEEQANKIMFEKSTPQSTDYDAQLEARDKALAYNQEQTRRYHDLAEEAMTRHKVEASVNYKERPKYQAPHVPIQERESYQYNPIITPESANERYIRELSQPNYNCAFDVIPLPSQGKLYKNKRPNIRIGYMTTADENILTSPNLVQSGEFLEILFNRKILETDLRYADLHVGDRNALMLWLRATAYGEMYPFTMLDDNGNPFDCEINLNELKTVNLGAEPDENGYFDFELPLSQAKLKIRLLTCGDIDDIERMVKRDTENGSLVNYTGTYSIVKSIVSVNGETNRTYIKDFVDSMRIQDSKKLSKFVADIESGVDLSINVTAPGGESIATFLPLNPNFFWPDFQL